jgi:two-component system, OmpR family, sensor histidine kinase QseC
MTSLRRRLFLILVAATGLIWLCGILWIFIGAKAELEHVLDTRLQEAARMVNSLLDRGSPVLAGAAGIAAAPERYERQLSCQIWSLDGHLIARSGSAPEVFLSDRGTGFSDRLIRGEKWRVYSIENASKGVLVMIGDRLGQRDQLVADLVKGLIIPGVLILPLLGGLIWLSLGRGLRPLLDMAGELQSRGADDMRPIDAQNAPSELRPLAGALNDLLDKVEAARRHEREVTAFAAHELRTPLAGLKTQAQIAMAAVDPGLRQGALRQILLSIDRTTRLVRQLLTLAKLDAGLELHPEEEVRVAELLNDIMNNIGQVENIHSVTVDSALHDYRIRTNRESFGIALRNLYENAVQHTPEGGAIAWTIASDGYGIVLDDEGPGIPSEELPLVSQRFFRGSHRTPTGCGLGLAIVDSVIKQIGGILILKNREEQHGLRAIIVLPADRIFSPGQAANQPNQTNKILEKSE